MGAAFPGAGVLKHDTTLVCRHWSDALGEIAKQMSSDSGEILDDGLAHAAGESREKALPGIKVEVDSWSEPYTL